jgi:Iodothyronine deiodinase
LAALEAQHRRYGRRVTYLIVYIREAHPEDGWVLEENRAAGVSVRDPRSIEERAAVATTCARVLPTTIPTLLDATDDAVTSAYGGWPDRLYLISDSGRIAYQGGEGPYGFDPDALDSAVRAELDRVRRHRR